MKNININKNCYGCGLCASVCPKSTIKIELNKDGFYTPMVDDSNCIECGLCNKICSFLNEGLINNNTHRTSFAAWSNNTAIREKASSGGIGYEIGKFLISNGFLACGVKYNIVLERAEHFITNSIDEFKQSIGSKYIQSYTVDAFKSLDLNKKYLITGTPCQIDSFRRYIRLKGKESNFVLLDFFCHGVPSMWMWKNYLYLKEKEVGTISDISWRNKRTGWHDSWAMHIVGEKKDDYSLRSKGDLFYKLFLGGWCFNPACVNDCKFKKYNSSADIRIGDFWGGTYQQDEKGVSALLSFTEVGNEVIKSMKEICTFVEHPSEIVTEGQMSRNAKDSPVHLITRTLLRNNQHYSLGVWNILSKLEFYIIIFKHIFTKYGKK